MPHFLSFFPSDHVRPFDLQGNEATLTIAKVDSRELFTPGKGKQRRVILYFEKATKYFILNKTNARTVATLYGPDTAKWVGQRVSLYATTTSVGSDTAECIRIRPQRPGDASTAAPPPSPSPPVREPGEEG